MLISYCLFLYLFIWMIIKNTHTFNLWFEPLFRSFCYKFYDLPLIGHIFGCFLFSFSPSLSFSFFLFIVFFSNSGWRTKRRPQFLLTRDDSPQISVIRFVFNVTWIQKRPRIHYYLLAIRLRTCIFISLLNLFEKKTASSSLFDKFNEKVSHSYRFLFIFSIFR